MPTNPYRILIVDDEEIARVGLSRILTRPDVTVDLAGSGEDALERLREDGIDYHVVLTDYRMPKMNGKELLETILRERPLIKVIMVTGKGSTATAVECMKIGAYDYIEKPFDITLIRAAVDRALRESQLSEDNVQLRKSLSLKGSRTDLQLVWEDAVMDRTILLAQKLAMTDDPILIHGESGSGKELLARTIHQSSRLKSKNFMAINCGAFNEELLVSELFGYERGAFTGATETKQGLFEATNGGTLFLDEIGEVPLQMQARFLRVLEQKEVFRLGGRSPVPVAFRLISASNRDLAKMSDAGGFRKDLYFRLGVHILNVPPLRERPEDLFVLFDHFCRGLAEADQSPPTGVSEKARDLMLMYAWPGNVRELSSFVRQMAVAAGGRIVDVGDLPAAFRANAPQSTKDSPARASEASETLEEIKLEHVRQALEKTIGNRTHAAKLLGISRVILHRLLLRHPELTRVGKGDNH